MNNENLSWEDAVSYIRTLPEFKQLIHEAYLDADPVDAVIRYAESEEWSEVLKTIQQYKKKGVVLDIGAGNGLASYAFNKAGYTVYAVEPCDGKTVGRTAIERVNYQTGSSIEVLIGTGECIPLPNNSIDIIFARQVIHHAQDIEGMCREVYRVLKPGGIVFAIREHVISHHKDLAEFLSNHPIHKLYSGENAYLLREYVGALTGAGCRIIQCYAPYDSVINMAPSSIKKMHIRILEKLRIYIPNILVERFCSNRYLLELIMEYLRFKNRNVPGRLFSFLAIKP